MTRLLREKPDLLVVQGDSSSALGVPWPVSWRACPLRMSRLAFGGANRTCRGRRRNIASRSTCAPTCCSRLRRCRGEPAYGAGAGGGARHRQHGDRQLVRCASEATAADTSRRRHAAAAGDLSSRESWGAGIESISRALAEMAGDGTASIDVVLHPNPHVASRNAQPVGRPRRNRAHRSDEPRERPPIRDCDLVLSNSGEYPGGSSRVGRAPASSCGKRRNGLKQSRQAMRAWSEPLRRGSSRKSGACLIRPKERRWRGLLSRLVMAAQDRELLRSS